jgi:hypothetical protein
VSCVGRHVASTAVARGRAKLGAYVQREALAWHNALGWGLAVGEMARGAGKAPTAVPVTPEEIELWRQEIAAATRHLSRTVDDVQSNLHGCAAHIVTGDHPAGIERDVAILFLEVAETMHKLSTDVAALAQAIAVPAEEPGTHLDS